MDKPKDISSPAQLRINGKQPELLGKKVRLLDHGLKMQDLIKKHKEKAGK